MLTNIDYLIKNYEIRQEMLEGRDFLVAPVVMLKEGVHAGSGGPMYYPPDEIAKSTVLWNGVPVTLPHPHDSEGRAISANSPETIADFKVGRLWNVVYDETMKSLKGEIWVDIEKVNMLQSGALLDSIKNQDQIDVSTGLFSADDGKKGTFEGEDFAATVSEFRPDHLALLPGTKGACSYEDGCGIRTNFSNKRSMDETMGAVYRAIEGLRTQTTHFYVQEVFKDFLIYERYGTGKDSVSQLFKHKYTTDVDGVVTLIDQPIEVKKQVKYVALKINSKEEDQMAKKTDAKCCPEKVQLLIENEATAYVEGDREWLETLTEEQIDKMVPKEEETAPTANAQSTPEEIAAAAAEGAEGKPIADIINENAGTQGAPAEEQTAEQYIANAPEGIRDMLSDGLSMHTNQKTALITALLANKNNTFTQEDLNGMDMTQLRKLSKLAQVNNYSGGGGTPANEPDENAIEPLAMPEMNWEK